MVDITTMMIDEYKWRVHNDNGPGLVPPAIPAAINFELKGHILAILKYIPFSGKGYEDAFKHIDEVLEIANYFNVSDVSRDAVLLRMLPLTLVGDEKIWLKSLAP